MKSDKPEIVQSDCSSCGRETRHEVLFNHSVNASNEWFNEKDSWQVVSCMGCLTISFRKVHEDFDDIEENEFGVASHAVNSTSYPRVIKNYKGLNSTYYLPTIIRKIYSQTTNAISEQSYLIASIGLRAIIEAVCNNLKISGSNLEKRIDQLCKAGHVSNSDKKRLHAIRFLGNDAAHELKEPQLSEIRIALEIIEHMLNTIYILEKKSNNLDVTRETYEEFRELLRVCASNHQGESAASLISLLGKHKRRITSGIESYEEKIIEDIKNGEIDYLKIGSVQTVDSKDIQLYEVIKSAFDDDIPF